MILLDEYWALYSRLTPEQKKAHDRQQRISWVYGNCKLSNPNVTWEMCEKVVDEKYPR